MGHSICGQNLVILTSEWEKSTGIPLEVGLHTQNVDCSSHQQRWLWWKQDGFTKPTWNQKNSLKSVLLFEAETLNLTKCKVVLAYE